jgi:hypothetical protein
VRPLFTKGAPYHVSDVTAGKGAIAFDAASGEYFDLNTAVLGPAST